MNTRFWYILVIGLLITVAVTACQPTPGTLSEPTGIASATVLPSATSSPDNATCSSFNILYHERPPYAQTSGQGATGLTASPAGSAFEKAGLPFQWVLTPSKRQLLAIQENQGCDCSIGWFKNPEREAFALFSIPIYQDKPQIAIARADNDKIQSGKTTSEVLSNPELVLGIKDGYSYGQFLDGQIATIKPTTDVTTAENTNMLLKVHEGRNDYFFLGPEEADSLIVTAGLPPEDFKYVTFTDMPQGEKRYVICSQRVGQEVMDQLNQALETIVTIP